MSDEAGRFSVRARLSGRFRVRVAAYGFQPYEAFESLNPWERLEVRYYLAQKPGQYETVITGKAERLEVVRQSISVEEVQRVPGTFGDALRVIQTLPGVQRAPFGIAALLVRGQSPRDSRTYLDGIEVPLLFHFGGLVSVFNSEMLSRINFYPGGFGAELGRATAGAVEVESRQPKRDRPHARKHSNGPL